MKSRLFLFVFIPFLMLSGTESRAQYYDSHDFVDLGLSVYWATANIGAYNTFVEYYGNYYAWGATATQDDFDKDNGLATKQKYYFDKRITTLEPQDDVATKLWGKEWRMPTREEFQELVDKCQWEWTEQAGIKGYRVTGQNGNSLFLPVTGMKSGKRDVHSGDNLYYWTSSCNSNATLGNPGAWMFYSVYEGDSDNDNRVYRLMITPLNRQTGRSVRPVSDQLIPVSGISLKEEEIEVEIGQEYQLTASYIPADATPKSIFWYSGNSAVAHVDRNGKVTGASSGRCTIRAVCGDYEQECQVTVTMPDGYVAPQQEEAVTIFRFGEDVKRQYIDSVVFDIDDSGKETKVLFKANIGDTIQQITVSIIDYADTDWNGDPGDFRIINFDVAGHQYQFKNYDWVREDRFENGYFHCYQVSQSQYLLFFKGFDYGCCPGTITAFAIDETGVYIVFNKEYDFREMNRDPFSMTLAHWYDESGADDEVIYSSTYTLFIQDGALMLRPFTPIKR